MRTLYVVSDTLFIGQIQTSTEDTTQCKQQHNYDQCITDMIQNKNKNKYTRKTRIKQVIKLPTKKQKTKTKIQENNGKFSRQQISYSHNTHQKTYCRIRSKQTNGKRQKQKQTKKKQVIFWCTRGVKHAYIYNIICN